MMGIKLVGVGLIGLSVLTASAQQVVDSNVIVRTTAYGPGVTQRPMSTAPVIDYPPIAGNHLVNLAMGRDVTATNLPDQVLSLIIPCDLSTVSLVVFDRTVNNVVGTIAISTNTNFYSADSFTTNAINNSPSKRTNEFTRFVALMNVQPTGSATNALLGGFLTVAGRIHRNPTNGCPQPVTLSMDRDNFDKTFAFKEVNRRVDPDTIPEVTHSGTTNRVAVPESSRVGLANIMGAVDVVSEGETNALMLPLWNMSIRYDVHDAP